MSNDDRFKPYRVQINDANIGKAGEIVEIDPREWAAEIEAEILVAVEVAGDAPELPDA